MAGSTSEFSHSNVLFQTQDGRPLTFYCLPGEVKTQIHPLVKHGGGILTSKARDENSIKLAAEGSKRDDTYSYRYILDCVEKNTLLPLEQYKLKGMSSTVSKTSVAMKASGKGREPFLKSEKLAILKYVAENLAPDRPVAGNKIWKEMELYKVTKHSWHAMRDHYLKYLKGKEHLFNLNDRLKYSKLQFRKDENQTMEEDDDLVELHSDDSNKDDSLNIDMFDSSAEEQKDPENPIEDSVVTSSETGSSKTGAGCTEVGSAQVSTTLTGCPQSPGHKVSQVEGDCGRSPEKTVVARVGVQKSSPEVQSVLLTSSDDVDNHLSVIAVDVKKVQVKEETLPDKRVQLHLNDAKDGEEQDVHDNKHREGSSEAVQDSKEPPSTAESEEKRQKLRAGDGQKEDGDDVRKEDDEDGQKEDDGDVRKEDDDDDDAQKEDGGHVQKDYEDGQKEDGDVQQEDGDGGQKDDGEDVQQEDGDDGQKDDGEDGQKDDGDDGQKDDGDDGQKDDGEDVQEEDGEDGQKDDGEDGQKDDGEDVQEEDGDDGQKDDGEDGQKEDGVDGQKEDGEDGQKEDGVDGQKEDGVDGEKDDGEDVQQEDGEDGEKDDGVDGQKKDGVDKHEDGGHGDVQGEDGMRQNKRKRDEEDESHLLTVLEGCVKIKELMNEFDLSLLMATRALYYNCGHLGATRTFLRTGKRPDDIPRPGWSRADESLLFDSDKENKEN